MKDGLSAMTGGVAAKARVVGPNQERWIRLLDTIDRDEVTRALRDVVREAGGVGSAAAYLYVSPEFLARRTGLPVKVEKTATGRLLPFSWPRTVGEVAPILRCVFGGQGSGLRGGAASGWRIFGLLNNSTSHAATVAAMREVAAPCGDLSEVARIFGVTRMVLWSWRRRWPDLGVALADKSGAGGKKVVGNRVSGKRRLSLEAAVDLMRPHLPGKASEVADRIRAAIAAGSAPHGVSPSARELSYYVGKPDSRGLMVTRWADRIGKQVVHVWTLVDTARGERIDGRESRREQGRHHCTLCGKPGHNRVKCPLNRERRSDGKKEVEKPRARP